MDANNTGTGPLETLMSGSENVDWVSETISEILIMSIALIDCRLFLTNTSSILVYRATWIQTGQIQLYWATSTQDKIRSYELKLSRS